MRATGRRLLKMLSKAFGSDQVLAGLLFGLAVMLVAPSNAAPLSTAVDPVEHAKWVAAKAQASQRISDFDAAIKTGNLENVRRSGLALQADPMAVQIMNQDHPNLVKANNAVTNTIKTDAKELIKNNMANEWNARAAAAGSKDRITPNDVTVYEPTNFKPANAKPKSGQDWDVTVRVRGQDVAPAQSQRVVEQSYYDAAGGERTFGKPTPGATTSPAAAAARRQGVETTHGKSLDAYNEAEVILGTKGTPPQTGTPLKDPQQLTQTIAAKSTMAGGADNAIHGEVEQARQAAKQYENITKPRVEAIGGQVHPKVDEGMKILDDVGKIKISPEEGRARLAAQNETPQSLRSKAAGQAESAQVLRPNAGSGTAEQAPGSTGAAGSKARKVLNAAGTTIAILDILGQAQDIRKDIKDGKNKEAAIKTAEAGANLATLGAYGSAKAVSEKLGERSDAQSAINDANKQNEVAYDSAARKLLLKQGVSRAEVDRIMDAKARGDESVLADKFSQLQIRGPEKIVENVPKADDSLKDRILGTPKDLVVGIGENAKKAGEFVKGSATDIRDSGVAAYDTRQENLARQQTLEDFRQKTIDHLVAQGATPAGAQKAADALLNGDPSKAKRLEELLDNKKAAAQGLLSKDENQTKTALDKATQERATLDRAAQEMAVREQQAAARVAQLQAQEKATHDRRVRESVLKNLAAAKLAARNAAADRAAQEKAARDQAMREKSLQNQLAAVRLAAQKVAQQVNKKSSLQPGTYDVVSGTATNKAGTSKLTYTKDAAGNTVQTCITRFNAQGQQIGKDCSQTKPPVNTNPVNTANQNKPVPPKPNPEDFAAKVAGVIKKTNNAVDADLKKRVEQNKLVPPEPAKVVTKGKPCVTQFEVNNAGKKYGQAKVVDPNGYDGDCLPGTGTNLPQYQPAVPPAGQRPVAQKPAGQPVTTPAPASQKQTGLPASNALAQQPTQKLTQPTPRVPVQPTPKPVQQTQNALAQQTQKPAQPNPRVPSQATPRQLQPTQNVPAQPTARTTQQTQSPVVQSTQRPTQPTPRPVVQSTQRPVQPTPRPVVQSTQRPTQPTPRPVVQSTQRPVQPTPRPVVQSPQRPVQPSPRAVVQPTPRAAQPAARQPNTRPCKIKLDANGICRG